MVHSSDPSCKESCDLNVTAINQVSVADITYIHILLCFIYLAVITDVFSRKVLGCAIPRNIDTQLFLDALPIAIHLVALCMAVSTIQIAGFNMLQPIM